MKRLFDVSKEACATSPNDKQLWRGGLPPFGREAPVNTGGSIELKNLGGRFAAQRGGAAFRQAPSPQRMVLFVFADLQRAVPTAAQRGDQLHTGNQPALQQIQHAAFVVQRRGLNHHHIQISNQTGLVLILGQSNEVRAASSAS